MKVQDVKKECSAIVGLSIEFSNSEIDSIVSLVRDLDISIKKGFTDLNSMVCYSNQINSELGFDAERLDPDKATVTVDLKSLFRAFKLLDSITNGRAFKPSHLFDNADGELWHILKNLDH